MSDLNDLNSPSITDTEPNFRDTLMGHILRAITWSQWSATANKVAGLMSATFASVSGGVSMRLFRRNAANTGDDEVVSLPNVSIGGNAATASACSGRAATAGTADAVKAGGVTYAMIQNVTAGTVLGRKSGAGNGAPQELPISVDSTNKVSLPGELTAAGVVESTTGGFKFPDGTTQVTAAVSAKGSISVSAASNMPAARSFYASASTGNQQVVVCGGYNASNVAQTTTYIYSLLTDTWATSGAMPVARAKHLACDKNNGTELIIAGGVSSSGVYLNATLKFNWAVPQWSTLAVCPITFHSSNAAFLKLDNGNFLLCGANEFVNGGADIYIFDTVSETWSGVVHTLSRGYSKRSGVKLADGRVLIVGYGTNYNYHIIASDGLSSVNKGAPRVIFEDGDIFLLPDHRVLLTSTDSGSTWIYDPELDVWSVGPYLHEFSKRTSSAMIARIPPHSAFACGGGAGASTLNTASIINPTIL